MLATREAVKRARAHGIGAVGVRMSNHFGTCMYYTLQAAREGCMMFLTTNGGPAMAPSAPSAPLPGTDVFDNYIGFNQHFGISLDRGAGYRSIRGNSFQANWNLAIDYGLDGPTTDVPDFSVSDRPVRRPTIGLAYYDAAVNKTLIEGVTETNPGSPPRCEASAPRSGWARPS